MTLDEIQSGAAVFIDSNIFIYHFTGVSDQCSRFLTRCELNDLNGVTSVNVILEVLHRLMLVEIVKKNILNPPNLVKKLQRKPEIVQQLEEYFSNTQKIVKMGIDIKTLTWDVISNSQQYRKKYGFLVNDSTILSIIHSYKLKHLASNDEAFLSIDDIYVYRPNDVEVGKIG